MAAIANGVLKIWVREGVDYTDRYPELSLLRELPAGTMLDGELVVIRNGRADFHALMARHSRRPGRRPFLAEPVRYIVFDLLYLGGEQLTHQPLSRRCELHEVLPASPHLACCEGIVGHGTAFFESTTAAGHEGVVAKRLTSRYTPNQRGTAGARSSRRWSCPA